MKYLSLSELENLLKELNEEAELYVSKQINGTLQFHAFGSGEDMIYRKHRAVQPLRSFLFPLRHKITEYFSKSETEVDKKIIILGAKECDIESIKVLDKVLFDDPFYAEKRKRLVIISTDCYFPSKYCFCTSMGLRPYPDSGFDANISHLISGGFVVEIGTNEGKRIFGRFEDAPREKIVEKNRYRRKAVKKLKKIVYERSFQELVRTPSPIWREIAKKCIECGGCCRICPTCHCFLICDRKKKDGYERIRVNDVCLFAGFARMAGGANPRAKLEERIKNRFLCKFDNFFDNFEKYGCVGCGRCIEACPGNIDVREILGKLDEIGSGSL